MLTKEDKLKILEKILSSAGFKSSKSYKKLLTYLVEASVNDIRLKEYSLAIDVFNKGTDFNSSEDSSVRVYVSNLRKKLDHYYATTGRNDKYKIEIPKGHYDLNFVPNIIDTPVKQNNNWKIISYILIPISLILFGYFLFTFNKKFNNYGKSSILNNPIWNNLNKNKDTKFFAIGNDLFFLEILQNEQTIVRKHYINTVNEFNYYKKTHPGIKNLEITPYEFFPLISIVELPNLLQNLKISSKIELKSSIELKANDINKHDVIFIGSFRNLHFFEYLMQDSLFKYSNNPNNLYIKIHDNDTTNTFKQIGNPAKESVDYCLFRKLPGPNNNTIYMFISFFKHGLSAGINFMLQEKSLIELQKLLEKKYGKTPEYFDVLFKSTGYSRTAFKTSVEYIHKTDPTKLNIW